MRFVLNLIRCTNRAKSINPWNLVISTGLNIILVCDCLWALCTTQSHGTKLYILVSKLRSGTSKTMQLVPVHLDLPLFWKSHCATCSPVYIILYHVTGSCKGPIGIDWNSTSKQTSRTLLVQSSAIFREPWGQNW